MQAGLTQTIGQEQRQRQEQRLSQQAMLRLQLLTKPLQELTTELRQQAQMNPFLEMETPQFTVSLDEEREEYLKANEQGEDYFCNGFEGYGEQRDPMEEEEATRKHDWQIASLTEPETLYRHLEQQVLEQLAPGPFRELVLYVCSVVDERGYLKTPPQEILSGWYDFCQGRPELTEREDLERAIRKVQELDPVGVGARSLGECFELQVRANPRNNVLRALEIRICQRLESLVGQTPEQSAKQFRCTPEEMRQALADLKQLNPFPGRAYPPPEPLGVPEIVAVPQPDGSWKAVCDERLFPLFRVDDATVALARKTMANRTAEENDRVKKLERQAEMLVEAYRERNSTLQRMAQLIFDRQGDFLASGGDRAKLKPLLQREIAKAIGYDESTVSRTIRNKFVRVATSREPIELKAFFSHAVSTSSAKDGETFSDQQVKEKLKALIEAEDRTHPLSDEALVQALAKEKITLARRTVAKYREQLDIPSTRERKRRHS